MYRKIYLKTNYNSKKKGYEKAVVEYRLILRHEMVIYIHIYTHLFVYSTVLKFH
jgi:hypothetical protein